MARRKSQCNIGGITMNQRQQVLQHLKQGRSITNFDAFNLYGITRLGAVIHDLRKSGHQIQDMSEPNRNSKGQHHCYFMNGEFKA